MTFNIKFGWQVLYRADSALFDHLKSTPLVRLVEPERYYNRISARNPTLYHPLDTEFTNLFHQRLRASLVRARQVSVKEKRFPYDMEVDSLGLDIRVGVSAQFFMPNVLSLRIICHNHLPLVPDFVFKQRQLHSHPILLFLCDEVVRIISSESCGATQFVQRKNHPIIEVSTSSEDADLLTRNREFFAALLINDKNFQDSDRSIFDRVFEENLDHNKKSQGSKFILINKQGFLSVTNGESKNEQLVIQDIKTREKLFELGYALQEFYEAYPAIRQSYPREMDYLFFATQSYIKAPGLTFKASFGNELAWNVILQSLRLRSAFESAIRFDVNAESKLSNLFDRIPHPHYTHPAFWDEVRDILGEDYVATSIGNTNITIQNNSGSISTGDNSPATTVSVGANKDELLKVLERLAQLRTDVSEGINREEFDEAIVGLRSEIKAASPDKSRLSKMLNVLKTLAEGTASHGIAIGLIHELTKLAAPWLAT